MMLDFRQQGPLRVCVLAASLGVASITRAEEPASAAAPDAPTARAEVAFREGVTAFASGRYHSAIALFLDADRLQPRPELTFDIARSYEKLGNAAEAARYYREYLRRAGHPPDEAEVRSAIARLESSDGPVAAAPAGDSPSGVLTTGGPFGPTSAAAGARPSDSDAERGSAKSAKVKTTLGWIGIGGAGAAFAGALVFEILRQNAENKAEHEHEQVRFLDDVQTMESDRTTARVLLGTGAGLALTGGIFLLLGANDDAKTRPAVAFRASPSALAADASWRF
jgi:tetratricopeptide (TPR) repeat protein